MLAFALVLLSAVHPLFGSPPPQLDLFQRDGHHSHHHNKPLLELNETAILMWHSPTPPSYGGVDFEAADTSLPSHSGLMIFHVAMMSLAFFVALPIAIAMRSVGHSWRALVVVIFYSLSALGCAAGVIYAKLTPDMYEGSVHGSHATFVILISLSVSVFDVLPLVRRFIAYLRNGEKFAFRVFWRTVVLDQEDHTENGPEYTELIIDSAEEFDASGKEGDSPVRESHDSEHHDQPGQWGNVPHVHRYSSSLASERTLLPSSRDPEMDIYAFKQQPRPGTTLLTRIGRGVLATLERALVFAAWEVVLTGIVTYTGICRQNYINNCLAHFIKGSIFWLYGFVTFGRFLGSFADLGWAWNRLETGCFPTAEFVESLVIFLYGITNTWMERFGANSGDPFTTRQIQHISIAVMFWFAGLIGMGIESRRIRGWLAFPSGVLGHPGKPGFIPSFNPFPALVIGITGAAMSAHAQAYQFQVDIHVLWGSALVGFALLRCLTYCLLWVSPPRSAVPSRPPTEALASFCLASGGLLFILSTEEITFAAMCRGRDDVMMFLNFAVAVTCFAFCWSLSIVAFKAWLKSRARHSAYHQ